MAGGFFSGGSSDAVNASVAEAEAAAREAEAARDEINNKFEEFAGQTEEGDYTVPNADDTDTTKFLNQEGNWVTPAGIDDVAVLDDLNDVNITNPSTGEFLTYNEVTGQWGNEEIDPGEAVTGGTGITVVSNEVSITNAGVGTTQLADDAVTTAKLGPDAVTNAKIADNAVQQANIATGSIDSTRLLNDAVTTDKILNNAVTTAKIAAGAVDNAQIADGAVDTDQIATDAVIGSKIADLTVTGGKIAGGSITEPKLSSTNTPTAGQVLSGNVDGTFTWVDQSGGGGTDNITASNGLARTGNDIAVVTTGLTSTQIADDAIITSKITTGAVTTNEIANATIVNGDIADTTITGAKIANATVTSTQLSTDAVTEVKIANNAVTNGKIINQAVNEDKLDVSNTGVAGQVLSADGDGTFTWVANGSGGDAYTADEDTLTLSAGNQFSINALGVDTAELAVGAVTSAKIMDNNVGATQLNVSGDGAAGQTLASDGDGSFTWISSNTLRGLTDTNIPASITDRRFLEYNTNTNVWDARAATEFLNISELFDVDINSIQDNQFLRYNLTDAKWENETISIPANLTFTTPLSRSGNTVSIPDVSITGSKIVDGTLETGKIADNAITGAKMADLSVDTAELAAGAVTAAKIADNTITGNKLVNNTLTAVQLATDSVTTFKIQADAVTTVKVADEAITEPKLDINNAGIDGQVLSRAGTSFAWVNNGSGGGGTYTADEDTLTLSAADQFSINALGVDTAELAAGAVTEAKIADGAVGSGKIATGAVANVDIADGAITNAKIADGTIQGGKIADGTIATAEITDNAINAAKLNVADNGTSGQVLSSDGDGSFSWVDEAAATTYSADGTTLNLTGTTFSVANDGITSTQLANNSVTSDQIANDAVTASEIATGVVSETKIADLAISTGKLRDQGVTVAKLALNIPISTWDDVNTSGVNNGQVLGYNGTTWVPVNASGGGTDNSRLNITLAPSSLNENDADTQIDVTLSIGNAISGETISGQSVTVTDPTGHTVTVTGSANAWMFTGNGTNVGNYVVRASATFTLTGGTTSVHSSSANLPVIATPPANSNWYYSTALATNPPTLVTDMTDAGAFSTGVSTSFTADGDGLHRFFIALPTRVGGYDFYGTPNFFALYTSTPEVAGLTTSGYTLYAIDDIDDNFSGTAPVYVEEM